VSFCSDLIEYHVVVSAFCQSCMSPSLLIHNHDCFRSEKEAKFRALEKLTADDNRFASDNVFVALAGLPW